MYKTGQVENPGPDSGAIKLREWLVEGVGIHSRRSAELVFLRSEYAIKAFCEGRRVIRLITPNNRTYEVPAMPLQ